MLHRVTTGKAIPFLALLLTLGCGPGDPGNQPVIEAGILVSGSDMGVSDQSINLSRAAAPVVGAEVLVNGTSMVETAPGHYSGRLAVALQAGAAIQIVVHAGADTVVGTAIVPTVPTLLTPLGGTTVHLGTPLDFTWIDSSNPDEFRVGVRYSDLEELASYGPEARAGTVVTSRIPSNTTSLAAFIYAYADGTFTGPASSGSRMRVRQLGVTVTIVPVP